MAFKPVLSGASQSSSFGHLRPPPQTSVTTTLNCTLQHEPHPTQRRSQQQSKAVDKAVDTWYNTGVGLKETQQTGAQ